MKVENDVILDLYDRISKNEINSIAHTTIQEESKINDLNKSFYNNIMKIILYNIDMKQFYFRRGEENFSPFDKYYTITCIDIDNLLKYNIKCTYKWSGNIKRCIVKINKYNKDTLKTTEYIRFSYSNDICLVEDIVKVAIRNFEDGGCFKKTPSIKKLINSEKYSIVKEMKKIGTRFDREMKMGLLFN